MTLTGRRDTMPKYLVLWSKAYHASGELVVEARDEDHAESIVSDKIGDLTGTTQYDPFGDTIEVVGEE
jgi:hypothetical protein